MLINNGFAIEVPDCRGVFGGNVAGLARRAPCVIPCTPPNLARQAEFETVSC